MTPPFYIHVENALWGDRSDEVMDTSEAGEISDNVGDSDHH